jgi:citrate lyase beta subunit
MPGIKDFSKTLLEGKITGLTTMVMCFEDSIKKEDVPQAEINALRFLDIICESKKRHELLDDHIPLIFFRVRSPEQFLEFSQKIELHHLKIVTGFIFPKFNSINGIPYLENLCLLNKKFSDIIYGMPILEGREIAFKESRVVELFKVKNIIDSYKDIVLNIRVGGADFSSCFGVRRGINYTIYDLLTVRDCLLDILNTFNRDNNYVISGPVWEYFMNDNMKLKYIPDGKFYKTVLSRIAIINEAVDGLLRELVLDKVNGFIGKTVIHPTHLRYVNAMQAVTQEEYNDAIQILATSEGVIKSTNANKMNEKKTHLNWANRIYMRAKAYGVIKDESEYVKLFSGYSNQ